MGRLTTENQTLLVKARTGDAAAFAELFESFRPLLYRLAYRLVGPDDCDDVVMDTYLKAWRAIPEFGARASMKTWLCRILRNCGLDHLRQRQRRQARRAEATEPTQPDPVDLLPAAEREQPDERAAAADLGQHIRDALATLSEGHRAAILLREVDGLSYREIAAATGVSIGTVMSRLFHAKRNLQKLLKGIDPCVN